MAVADMEGMPERESPTVVRALAQPAMTLPEAGTSVADVGGVLIWRR